MRLKFWIYIVGLLVSGIFVYGCSTSLINSTAIPTLETVSISTPYPTVAPIITPSATNTNTVEVTPTPPTTLLFRYTRGVRYLEIGAPEEAISEFTLVIKMVPDFAQAYHGRGLAYYEKENYEKAMEDYNKAIELKPDLADAFKDRGKLQEALGETDKAIADLQKALVLYHNIRDARDILEVKSMLEFLK